MVCQIALQTLTSNHLSMFNITLFQEVRHGFKIGGGGMAPQFYW